MKHNHLLTINQLAKLCSTSRATLLRMERDGILVPVYQNKENGYRYYDDISVLLVNTNLALHEAGISHKEMREYYHQADSSTQLLQNLESRLHTLEYHIANLRLQLNLSSSIQVIPFTFPEIDCYAKQVSNVADSASLSDHILATLHETIQKGHRINRHTSLFNIFDFESTANTSGKNGYEYTICIPVIATKAKQGILHFPSREMLSCMIFGGSNDIVHAVSTLKEYARTNQIPFENKAYIFGIVNSFPAHTPTNDAWVTQVCLPVIPLSKQ